MVVSKCPICSQFLVGFQWTKTAKGKNWLKKGDVWHDCPSKKMAKKTASKSKKLFGPNVGLTPENGYDSEAPGYYCTQGHYLGGFEGMDEFCPKCNKPTTCTWLHPGGPH